jgi:phosphoenolpyruvate carboxylase
LLDENGFYRFPAQFKADLEILKSSLEAVGARRLVLVDVGPIDRALETFGFHLAQLDIRQNSAFHDRALSQLMVAAGLDGEDFSDWSEAERLRFLNAELRSPRPFCTLVRSWKAKRAQHWNVFVFWRITSNVTARVSAR